MTSTTVNVRTVLDEALSGVSVPTYYQQHVDAVASSLQSRLDAAVESLRASARSEYLSSSRVEAALTRAGLVVDVPEPVVEPEPVDSYVDDTTEPEQSAEPEKSPVNRLVDAAIEFLHSLRK